VSERDCEAPIISRPGILGVVASKKNKNGVTNKRLPISLYSKVKVKVKQSNYRPGRAQRLPG
jgi:hypothetical protein